MNGIFILLWTDDGYVVKGKFWQQEGDASIIDNLLMRIALSHESKKEFSMVPTQIDTFIFSRLYEFRDTSKIPQKVIVGVELAKGENKDDYKKFLIDACSKVPEMLTKDDGEIEQELTAIFASQSGEAEQTGDRSKDLLAQLKERAKDLIKNGDIDEANDLLEKAKTVPGALQKLIDKGTKLIKQQKIDEAEKVYNEAIDLALSIQEDGIAAKLQDDLARASERPKIIEIIKDIETKAKKALREENIKRAAELYKDAATEAVKLNDVDAMNEFTKKSQALFEFSTADQKKKRSF